MIRPTTRQREHLLNCHLVPLTIRHFTTLQSKLKPLVTLVTFVTFVTFDLSDMTLPN